MISRPSIEFIEHSLEILIANKGIPPDTDLKNAYFAGRSLCLDTCDEFFTREVICLNYDEQTYGFFSGNLKYLLSLKALELLKRLMHRHLPSMQPKQLKLIKYALCHQNLYSKTKSAEIRFRIGKEYEVVNEDEHGLILIDEEPVNGEHRVTPGPDGWMKYFTLID